MKTKIHFWSYLTHLFLELEMFQKKVVEKIKTHILCSVNVFRKPCRFWDIVEKYYRTEQGTGGNTAHAYCMLDT
jgi:GH35 family endo-1,4-beta-xylanase